MFLRNNQMQLAIKLKDAILDAYDPEAVILFGSLGRGDADEFSDIDLLVIMETVQDSKEVRNKISESLNHITTNKHIIVKKVNEFIHQFDIPGTLVFPAMNEGQILFEKTDILQQFPTTDSYITRKQKVIKTEYLQKAHEYLTLAEASLKTNHMFRCRDFAKFAAIRATKGLFVRHDIHPPRDTDLVQLFHSIKKFEPGLMKYNEFLRKLNTYCPEKTGDEADLKSAAVLQSTSDFIEHVKDTCLDDNQKSNGPSMT
ncbi:nucleotidyltransferase domain-containing protein [Desulfobacula phenolica]|nr:nucleotidyltransferase domain-containing protein [Desulfobacula phenolica]